MSGLDLLDDVRRNAAGRAVLFQPFHHLAFGREEHLEQLAQFLGGHLLLPGGMQRLAVLRDLVARAQELLAGGGRLLRRPEAPPGMPGDIPGAPGMPGIPPNCAAAGDSGKTASPSTNGRARLSVMASIPPGVPRPPDSTPPMLRPRY